MGQNYHWGRRRDEHVIRHMSFNLHYPKIARAFRFAVCRCNDCPTRLETVGEASVPNPERQQARRHEPAWKDAHKWFVYDASVDKVICKFCRAPCEMGAFLSYSSGENDSSVTFLKKGFSSLKEWISRGFKFAPRCLERGMQLWKRTWRTVLLVKERSKIKWGI